MLVEGGVAAASIGAGVPPDLAGATSATSSNSLITIVAVILAVTNLVVLTVIGAVCLRRARHKRASAAAAAGHKQGAANGGFRPDGGTLRSFNSLSSKFTPTDAESDSLSTSSSASTVS